MSKGWNGLSIQPLASSIPSLLILNLKYRAAQAHAALVLRAANLEIPDAYNYCKSYQSYVEHVVSKEQKRRNFLRETHNEAQQVLSAIKMAAEDGYHRNLDDQVLEISKLEVLAFQEHSRDATAACLIHHVISLIKRIMIGGKTASEK